MRLLTRFAEPVGDLLVEFVAVGDDDDTGVRLVLADPLREPDHHQRLARALRVPDDAALLLLDPRLGGIEREDLVRTHHLLHARVENDGIVDEPQEPLRLEHLKDRTVHRVLHLRRREHAFRTWFPARFLPLEPVLRRRQRRPVLDALGFASRNQQLRRREKAGDLAVLLVAPVLADTLLDGHGRFLEFDDAEQDAVHIKTHVRTSMRGLTAGRWNADLLGDRINVVERILPVNEPRLLHRLARLGRHRNGESQHSVDILVGVVERRLVRTVRRLLELGDNA